jgi:hypothetical protein
MKTTTKQYAAWTRKAGSNDQLVTTMIKATSLKDASKQLKELGREIDGKPYKY